VSFFKREAYAVSKRVEMERKAEERKGRGGFSSSSLMKLERLALEATVELDGAEQAKLRSMQARSSF